MTDALSEEQIVEFSKAFRFLDKDGDGCINLEELGSGMRSLGQNPTRQELQFMIHVADTDANGTVEFQEFLNLMATILNEAETEEDLQETFKVFDRDRDGFISPFELKHVMIGVGERVTEEEVAQMMKDADLNGDGLLDYHDFVTIMLAL